MKIKYILISLILLLSACKSCEISSASGEKTCDNPMYRGNCCYKGIDTCKYE